MKSKYYEGTSMILNLSSEIVKDFINIFTATATRAMKKGMAENLREIIGDNLTSKYTMK